MLQLSTNVGVLLQLFTRKICTVLELIERVPRILHTGKLNLKRQKNKQ